jgi:hypothetical protein
MLGTLEYSKVQELIQTLKQCCVELNKIDEVRGNKNLMNFIGTVENYIRYLEDTLKMGIDADEAIKDLIEAQ